MGLNKSYLIAGGILMSSAVLQLANTPHVDAQSQTITVLTAVNFRLGPSTQYSSMGVLQRGTELSYLGKSGNWMNVEYEGKTGYVHENYVTHLHQVSVNLNFRTGPSTDYPVISVIQKGDYIEVLDIEGSWVRARYNGKTGYASKVYVLGTNQQASDCKYVTASVGLNVRSGPGTGYSRIGKLAYGKEVNVISTSNGWSKINYNGSIGYVSSAYLGDNKPNGDTVSSDKNYVTASFLNVRSGPGKEYSIVGVLNKGKEVDVISTSNGWAKIKYNGSTAYISVKYISGDKTSDNTSDNTPERIIKYAASRAGLNVRRGPDTSYSVLGTLHYGEKVEVISISNGWAKIKYNGSTGYVSNDYLSSTKPADSYESSSNENDISKNAADVIAYAKTFLGKPYVWGAVGPNSFDCSGFTYYVFKNKAGITLPRTSNVQSMYGKYVKKSELIPGDLVFFDTTGANDGNVSHVGIYIGNGKMIHSSYSQGKVVIVNFYSDYFNRTYVNARRVL